MRCWLTSILIALGATSCAHRAPVAQPVPAPVGFTLLPASNPASSQPVPLVNRPALVLIRQGQIEADRVLSQSKLAGHTEDAKDDAKIDALQALVSPWRLYGVPAVVGVLGVLAAAAAAWGGFQLGHAAAHP